MTETEYQYLDIESSPDLSLIHDNVAISEMIDKNIEYCRWDEDTEILKVYWQEALSAGDKIILDGIVADNS